MIPRHIHYIWLGGKKKPANFNAVLASWHLYAPDFSFKEWTEADARNFDLPPYYDYAYKSKKYAFASDVLRFHILTRHGGIYLDIDEILIRSIDTPELLNCQTFLARYHESEEYLGFGAIGSIAGSPFCKQMSDYYASLGTENFVIVNKFGSQLALKIHQSDPSELTIFPQEYFYPLTDSDITSTTYGKHLGNTSWIPRWKKVLHRIPAYPYLKRWLVRFWPKTTRIEY